MADATVILDPTAWVYIGVTIAWTIILACGMGFLWYHRRLPGLQIRRLPLVFVAIVSLHCYWIVCMLGYIIGPFAPCTAEFWIMSIYLPFGIAMFQLANSRFLDVASRQKKFASFSIDIKDMRVAQEEKRWKKFMAKASNGDKINRMIVWVAIGLVVQFLLTLFIFLGSRKFHYNYGIWNFDIIGSLQEQRMRCSKGWEWWLSIVWQFFWSWLYAPYILWKSRRIHDVNGWRVQTIACCLAGLPASPLWLAGLYSPAFAPVNKHFIPPNWFSLSTFLIEIFTIFLPCYQVLKTHNLRQETLEAISSWDKRNRNATTGADDDSATKVSSRYTNTISKFDVHSTVSKVSASSHESDSLTMGALENTLRTNADPLLKFAALKDFSGENVAFLTHLSKWKANWQDNETKDQQRKDDIRRLQFHWAVIIYSALISLDWAEFPINISSKTFRALEMFAPAADMINKRRSISSESTATPFDDFGGPPAKSSSETSPGSPDATAPAGLKGLGEANLQSATCPLYLDSHNLYQIDPDLPIPEGFGPSVFDDAESEIKYLILTNTWPKFVRASFVLQSDDSNQEKHRRSSFLAILISRRKSKPASTESHVEVV